LGVEVTIAADGREAVDAFRTRPFDLILMDVQMPVTDGIRATEEIRRMEAEEGRAGIPIIALSANVMAHQTAEYLAVGMNAVVGKPFEAEALYAAIAEQLAGGEADAPAPERLAS